MSEDTPITHPVVETFDPEAVVLIIESTLLNSPMETRLDPRSLGRYQAWSVYAALKLAGVLK